MRMSRRSRLLLVGATVAGLLVGGAAIASNMGFKLIFPLVHTGTLGANDVSVSLPFNTPFQKAQDIFLAAPSVGDIASVTRLNPASNTQTIWFPSPSSLASDNFNVAKGEGYLIRIPAGTNSSITFVGSHDPSFAYNFNVVGRQFLISIPYHTTWQKAQDVFLATPFAASVSRLEPTTNLLTIWFPSPSSLPVDNFPITIGEAYRMTVGQAPSVLVPEHF